MMTSSSWARSVLNRCADIAALDGPPTDRLAAVLRAASARLDEPMRVAVVGQIKRGKSTLVNALLGEDVAPTGELEVTYTVTELFYAEQPTVVVSYRDGRQETVQVGAFEQFTRRDGRHLELLRQIRTVAHGRPNPLLRSFRLVDTPGLASVHGVDSRNSAEQLGITSFDGSGPVGAAVAGIGHEDSDLEVGRADAVLYLFSRGLHEKDRSAVVDVVGSLAGTVSPLKAFGVLSRCDQQWPPSRELPGEPDPSTFDPMAASQEIAERYLARRDVGRLFYTIAPVAGLVGLGAQTLTAAAFNDLADLAALEPHTLVRRLRDANRFATRAELPDVALPVDRRATLARRLSAWGILRACGYLRDGLTESQVRQQLLVDSGVDRLRRLIVEHFGNRAAIIKLDHGYRTVLDEIGAVRLAAQRTGAVPPAHVGGIAADIEQLRQREHGFAELAALSSHYRGELDFTAAEVADLLRVTGEYGTSCAARLGLPAGSGTIELERVALRRIEAWARREQDPMLDRPSLRAARTIRRSYERVAHLVRRAAALLETGDELTGETLRQDGRP